LLRPRRGESRPRGGRQKRARGGEFGTHTAKLCGGGDGPVVGPSSGPWNGRREGPTHWGGGPSPGLGGLAPAFQRALGRMAGGLGETGAQPGEEGTARPRLWPTGGGIQPFAGGKEPGGPGARVSDRRQKAASSRPAPGCAVSGVLLRRTGSIFRWAGRPAAAVVAVDAKGGPGRRESERGAGLFFFENRFFKKRGAGGKFWGRVAKGGQGRRSRRTGPLGPEGKPEKGPRANDSGRSAGPKPGVGQQSPKNVKFGPGGAGGNRLGGSVPVAPGSLSLSGGPVTRPAQGWKGENTGGHRRIWGGEGRGKRHRHQLRARSAPLRVAGFCSTCRRDVVASLLFPFPLPLPGFLRCVVWKEGEGINPIAETGATTKNRLRPIAR